MAIYLDRKGRAVAEWEISSPPAAQPRVYLENAWYDLDIVGNTLSISIIGPNYDDAKWGPAPNGSVIISASCHPDISIDGNVNTGGWILLTDGFVSTSTTNVTALYTDSSDTPIPGASVVATLKGPTTTTSGRTVSRVDQVQTYPDGSWVLSLLPNDMFGDDSYYVINVGNKESYEVIVPVTESLDPVQVTSILRNAPVDAPNTFRYSGNMALTGDLFVDGDISISVSLTAHSIIEHASFSPGEIPTFPGNLQVIGNLSVSGVIKAKGIVTAGS